MDRTRRRAWLSAALLSLALLALPLVAWFLVPAPVAPLIPQEPAREVPAGEAQGGPVAPEAGSAPGVPTQEVAAAATRGAPPSGSVRGLVLDPEGNPAAGAFVSCENGGPAAGTDTEGRFELPPEADGCMAVATLAVVHQPSERTRLTAGRSTTLQLTAGGVIEGIVVDEQGRSVEHYLLAVESFVSSVDPQERFGNQARTISNPGGTFRWERLPPGTFVLAVSAEGRPPVRSGGITVEVGRTTAQVRLVLSRGAALSGRVIDAETRAPLAEARVQLDAVTSSGANAIAPVVTDAAGTFALEGVPARGPFSVRVQHAGYMTKIVPALDARGTAAARVEVALRQQTDGGPNEELVGIGATLLPGATGVQVVGVVEGGPAARAGFTAGDRLVRLDGVDATGLGLSECVQRLRGAPGTRVSVSLDRGGQVLELTLTREVIVR